MSTKSNALLGMTRYLLCSLILKARHFHLLFIVSDNMTKVILRMMSHHIWTINSPTQPICARLQKDKSGQLPFPSMTYWKIGSQDAFELLRYFGISLIKYLTGKVRVEIVLVHKIWNAWLEGLPMKSCLHWRNQGDADEANVEVKL